MLLDHTEYVPPHHYPRMGTDPVPQTFAFFLKYEENDKSDDVTILLIMPVVLINCLTVVMGKAGSNHISH